MFEIGDKVVCVDDSPSIRDGVKYLVRGSVYVVLKVWHGVYHDYAGLVLVVTGQPTLTLGWRAYRFRKLSDMQQEARERMKQAQENKEELKA